MKTTLMVCYSIVEMSLWLNSLMVFMLSKPSIIIMLKILAFSFIFFAINSSGGEIVHLTCLLPLGPLWSNSSQRLATSVLNPTISFITSLNLVFINSNFFFFGKLTYVLKEEDTNIIRGIPQIYNDNRNIKQQMATG